ncbi:Bro-N domain-containing protein, partial [Liquorilactobacillus nagelii]|uniref:BRO-N domain-containing protein n=1 Tax=Liquorilactobacillus nagelii TaxID=82688 RepID=UPI0039ED5D26
MNELINFSFQGNKVRTVQISNEPYFVGKDVAEILGYQNGSRDINRHVDEEDRQNYQNGTFESPRGLTVINESGLYSLILSSKMPNAKQFKHWVTSEVLPSIRKHGAYMTPETLQETLAQPENMIQ